MTLTKPNAPTPADRDEFAARAANAAQLVPAEGTDEEQHEVGFGEQTTDAAQEEEPNRGPLQTREAYLKKGEDLIRSLL